MFESIPGIQLLHQIQVEQTTPTGTVVFLAVMVAVFMLGAIALYAAAMTAIWYVRFRQEHTPLHRVFLPSAAQLREHAAEYSLAVATSLILSLSLAAKHSTVEHLKTALGGPGQAQQGCGGQLDLGHLFPLHVCPDQLADAGVLNLLEVTAEQGQTREAEFVVKHVYTQEADAGRLPLAWITDERLRMACLLLLIGHVLWLVRGRSDQLAASPEGGELLDYSEMARPLLALSMCAALLLLAAPAVLPTADNVASATIASIQDEQASANGQRATGAADPRTRIAAVLERQRHNLGLLDTTIDDNQTQSIFARINSVRERLDQVDTELRADGVATKGQVAALDELHRRDIDALRTVQGADRDRVSSVDTLVQSQAGGLKALQEQVAQAQSGLQANVDGQRARLDDMQNAVNQTRAQVGQATDLAESTRDAVTGRLNDLSGSFSQLQATLQRLNAQLGQQIQGVRSDLGSDIKDEAQARAQLARRIADLEQAGRNAGAAAGNLDDLNGRFAEVMKGLGDLDARVTRYHQPGTAVSPGISDNASAGLQRLSAQLGQQIQNVRSDLGNDIRDEAQARAQLARRIAELEQAGRNTGAAAGNAGDLSGRLAAVIKNLSDLDARVTAYHRTGTRVPVEPGRVAQPPRIQDRIAVPPKINVQ